MLSVKIIIKNILVDDAVFIFQIPRSIEIIIWVGF